MQGFAKFLAVLAIVGFVGFTHAADKGAGKAKALRGEVVSVDGTNVKVKTKDGQEVTVATDDKTVVTVDGKDGKVADLKAGQKVRVSPDTGTAAKIVVGGGGKKAK